LPTRRPASARPPSQVAPTRRIPTKSLHCSALSQAYIRPPGSIAVVTHGRGVV